MSIFSYSFFALWIICVIAYYTIARSHQWFLLFIMSLVFYACSITKAPFALIFVSIITYSGAVWCVHARKSGKISEKAIKYCRWIISGLSISVLVIGPITDWFAMLGNSYFTLKAISYLIDADRNEKNCERNFFFYLLYLVYLPTILQGPFNRFLEFKESLAERIEFDYTGFMHGIQRFLWGAFKKLVLAARLEQIGTYVFSDWSSQSGISISVGVVAYSLWFYTDFSSYMDMMLGVSGTFGIALPENFRQPYFSQSIAEFWRRWHITLGGVLRDYLMMPFIQSKQGRNLRKHFKKYGKNAGKLAPVLVGTFLVWFSTALWHGLSWNYMIWGMYYCMIISCSLVLEGTYEKIKDRLRINSSSKGYALFCMVRTWGLLFVANIILQIHSFKEFFTIFHQLIGRSFFSGGYISLSVLGWGKQEVIVLIAGLLLLLLISVLKEKNKNILEIIDKQVLPVRWAVYYVLLFSVLLFGMYGSQYDAGQFLYMQF